MDCPKFLEQTMFEKLFTSQGRPKKYLALIIPLLHKNYASKDEMLESSKVDPNEVSYGFNSNIFAEFNKTKIIAYDQHLKKWQKGDNWYIFLGWLLQNLCQHEVAHNRFSSIIKRYASNATNFINSLDEWD